VTGGVLRDIKRRRFWTALLTYFFSAIGVLAAGLGLYDVVDPDRIAKGNLPLVLTVVIFVALLYGLYRSWPRPVEQEYSKPNTMIRIIEGDLFEQQAHQVVGMCDTFDTEPPNIIERRSVQGQLLSRVYRDDRGALDADLDAALSGISSVGRILKPGKQDVYPVGTVAVLKHPSRQYYCVAYTSMNRNNNASATVEGVWKSLESLWRSVNQNANGEAVAIPVIGGGQARISQVLPAQDSVRLTALSFMLASRQQKVCDRLDIIVRKGDIERLNMLELQAFLESLA
jgi:Domain of unknown function (DUF6430)